MLNAKHAEQTHQAALMGQQISRAREASRQREYVLLLFLSKISSMIFCREFMTAAAVAEHNRRALAEHYKTSQQQQQQLLGISTRNQQPSSISPGPFRKSGAQSETMRTSSPMINPAAVHAQQLAALQQQVWLQQQQQAFAASVIQAVPAANSSALIQKDGAFISLFCKIFR